MECFLWRHDIDLALLQEVTSPQLDTIRRYAKYINVGTDRRGTAILAKDELTLTNIKHSHQEGESLQFLLGHGL
jgi:hypothetical protein